MAYDRDDMRHRPRDDHRWSNDRHEGRGRSGGDGERGFFERAGDEIASWFGYDEDERGRQERGRDYGRGDHRERGRQDDRGWFGRNDRSNERSWFGGRDRDDERGRYGGRRDEPDERGWFRTNSYTGRAGQGGYGGSSGMNRGRMDRDNGDYRAEGDYRPMTGDYGRSEDYRDRSGYGRGERDRNRSYGRERFGDRGQSHWDRDDYRGTSFAGSSERSQHHDPHYRQWRERRLQELDREYDEYHRERQSKFEEDFGGWRERRQSKRQILGQVRAHMEVVGSDDEHVGTVDKVADDRIILTRSDAEAGGVHHSIGCSVIDRIDGDRLRLECTAEEARKRWRNEDRNRALFEREDQGDNGTHMLDRSFSGTYR